MSFNIDKLTSMDLDVLKEVGNIGAGNSATSLSKLLNKRITMNVPEVQVIEFQKAADAIGGADAPVVGVYLEFYGDINGTVLYLLGSSSASKLISLLLNKAESKNLNDLDEVEISAFKEIANILTGAYLGSLSELTGLKVNYSVPAISIDMAGAILTVPIIEYGEVGDKTLFIESHLIDGNSQIQNFFFLIPSTGSFPVILKALGVKLNE